MSYMPTKYRDISEDDMVVNHGSKTFATNKSELRKLVNEFIETEFQNMATATADKTLADLQTIIDKKMATLEKEIATYIEFKVDKIATDLCERMLTSGFEREVNNRVQQLMKVRETIELTKGKKEKF